MPNRLRPGEVQREEWAKETWTVERTAIIEEVKFRDGKIRYNVQVHDEERPPFLDKYFNDPTPASDFVDRLRMDTKFFGSEERD